MQSKRCGFILMDTLVGMLILAGLTMTAATAAGWQRRAAREMSDLRGATDLAESALIDLHQGTPLSPAPSGAMIKIEPLPGGASINGYTWCRVTATVNGRSVALIGLRLSPAEKPQAGSEVRRRAGSVAKNYGSSRMSLRILVSGRNEAEKSNANIEHPTSNIEHRSEEKRIKTAVHFEARCWTLDVRCSHFSCFDIQPSSVAEVDRAEQHVRASINPPEAT